MGSDLASVVFVAGAFVLMVGGISGGWLGWVMRGWRSPQEAVTRRELMGKCKALRDANAEQAELHERQLNAIRTVISRFKLDQRTSPHDVLFMKEHVDPLLTPRER